MRTIGSLAHATRALAVSFVAVALLVAQTVAQRVPSPRTPRPRHRRGPLPPDYTSSGLLDELVESSTASRCSRSARLVRPGDVIAAINRPRTMRARAPQADQRPARARQGGDDATAHALAQRAGPRSGSRRAARDRAIAAQNIIGSRIAVRRQRPAHAQEPGPVVTLICPANPDGLELVARAYMATRRVGRLPVLYQRYIATTTTAITTCQPARCGGDAARSIRSGIRRSATTTTRARRAAR